MILYFTGTGNSEYVAKRIAEGIGDEMQNLFSKIRGNDTTALSSDRPWVVVVPTYAWRIPQIVEKWMEKTVLLENQNIYFVLTCGSSMGNAGKYLQSFCLQKGMEYLGCYEIVMPENYIALFSTPAKEEAISTIDKAEVEIDKVIRLIRSDAVFPERQSSFLDKMSSGIINSIFYPVFVHAKKFYVTKDCISCSLCEKVCPMANIKMTGGRPEWGGHCTHCMACICRCPEGAIEYGRHSRGLPRYTCPK